VVAGASIPPVEDYLRELANADLATLRAEFGGSPPATAALGFSAWPWEIAKKGGEYFGQHVTAATSLAKAGQGLQGSAAVSALSSNAKNPANTDQVFNNGIFSNALNSVKADDLLRTVFIGWAASTQVGIFGGGGGAGVVYDITDPSHKSPASYGSGGIGLGARVSTGLILGAFSRPPGQLDSSTAVFEFGAGIAGIGALIGVIMNLDLHFLGFTLIVGLSAGFSGATGYGKING
jgi:hypothetical protein